MAYQKTFIPCIKGPDDSVDERINPPDVLGQVTNGYFEKTGRIAKRHGFTRETMTVAGSGSITGARTMFSTGDELCFLDERNLWAQSAIADRWIDRGKVGPCVGSSHVVFQEEVPVVSADMAHEDGYIVYAGIQQWSIDTNTGTAANIKTSAIALVKDTGRSTIRQSNYTGFASGTGTAKPTALRAFSCTNRLLIAKPLATSTATSLQIFSWSTSSPSPTTGFQILSVNGTVTTDLYRPSPIHVRTFDCIRLGNGGYAIAYIDDSTRSINLVLRNSSHMNVATATIAANDETDYFKRVALSEDTLHDELAVLASRIGSTGDILELYSFSSNDLGSGTPTWGPVNVETIGNDEEIENIGVCPGPTVGNPTEWVCTWTMHQSSWVYSHLGLSAVSIDGSNSTQEITWCNLNARSRPFVQDGRYYVVCDTTVASHVLLTFPGISGYTWAPGYHTLSNAPIECAVIMEIEPSVGSAGSRGGTIKASLAGLHDIGTAPTALAGSIFRTGNGCNVVSVGAVEGPLIDKPRYTYVTKTYDLRGVTNASYDQSHAVIEVELDFTDAAAPQVAVLSNGVACIGGSFVGWYDGVRTSELGHAVMPVPYAVDDNAGAGAGSLSDNVTYSWQSMWAWHDAKGVLHRSLPSFQFSYLTASGGATDDHVVDLVAKINPATLRNLATYSSTIAGFVDTLWYRVDGLIPKQVSEAVRYTEQNIATGGDDNVYTDAFDDIGQDLGPSLYTVGGEIEAVCPEGARLPVVAGGRLWLGDLFRRDRVQYSKVFAPGTATETAIAPEFNEGFGYIMENGQSVTAMTEMDDKVIIFTEGAIFTIAGQGPADDGSANDFSGLTVLSSDAGCIEARSVVSFPDGVLFQGKAGVYFINRGMQLQYIGKTVEDTLASYPVITSAVLVPAESQVRFTCIPSSSTVDGRVLVYDYRIRQWTVWTLPAGENDVRPVSACMHKDEYYVLDSNARVWKYDTSTHLDDGSEWVTLTVDSGWFQSGQPAGWQRVRKVAPVLEYKTTNTVRVHAFQDYDDTTPVHTAGWVTSDIRETGSDRMIPLLHLRKQKCSSFKVRVDDTNASASGTGESFTVAGFLVEWMPRRGTYKPGSAHRS